MRSKLFLLLVVLLVCLFTGRAQTVNENESSLVFTGEAAHVSIVLDNPAKAFDGKIQLELLDNYSEVRASISQNVRIREGKGSYDLVMPIDDLLEDAEDEVAWFRLRYRVGNVTGIISLSQIIRDIFELKIIASDQLLSGMTHRSRVRALNPITGRPVGGVHIEAVMTLDLAGEGEKKIEMQSQGETDNEGFSVLDFQIPVGQDLSGDGELTITGRKNGIIREAENDLLLAKNDYQFLMLSDKPIYQPEQTFNVRGILLRGVEAKVVEAGSELEFRIEDEEDTVVYSEKVKTSDFGVAAITWKIPANAKLGTYKVRVKSSGDENEYVGYKTFKLSRYDLPNFSVTAKSDKTFYLPGEKEARIDVRADYLFGKPVLKGKVRVVRETERKWNWKEQKYDIEEGDSQEGKTDAQGRFLAKFDLSGDHDELKEDSWQKFEDLNFTAYFTDLSTNRTEQRRFDVRVTKGPIHVYFIGNRDSLNPGLPVNGYVSTFYADGTPAAACDVEIKGSEDEKNKFKTLQRLKTNSLGAGKFRFMRPKYEDEDDMDLGIIARDKNGRRGINTSELDFDEDDDTMQIQTERTIYKPGESITITLNSTRKTGPVYIDIVKGWSVIDSQFTRLENGTARLVVPYRDSFKGQVTIAAFMEKDDQNGGDLIRVSRGIIYPAPQNLNLEASLAKETYKPGEEASISFGVTDSLGQAVQSALGVVVFDKAVEERAKTEDVFGDGIFGNFQGFLGYGESFGGINIKSINEIDLSKPISDDMQLVAEVILADSYYHPNIFSSDEYETDAKWVYSVYFKKHFDPIEAALTAAYKTKNFEHPRDAASLEKILSAANLNLNALRDPWEQGYRAVFGVEKTQDTVGFMSAGADKIFGTRDDLLVSSMNFTYFTPTGNAIDTAIKNYHSRTGKFIRDEKTLFGELGVSSLTDRYDRPYKIFFEVSQRHFVTRIRSAGPDGVFSPYNWYDDFDVWTHKTDYFAETETKILEILKSAKTFPRDEAEFRSVLRAGGADIAALLDGYGEKVYVTKRQFSRYIDKTVIENVTNYGDEKAAQQRTTIIPVTQEVITFQIRGKGDDKREGSSDDVTLAQFLHVISEQSKDDIAPKPAFSNIVFVSGTGSIAGMITDPNGAAVANAAITATNEESKQNSSVTSDSGGKYLIANLTPGSYSVSTTAPGFSNSVQQNVPVSADATTTVNISLSVAGASMTVDVAAADETTNNTAQVSNTQVQALPINGRRMQNYASLEPDKPGSSEPKSTPRLREYFPETLFWNPELVTDTNGKAEMKFKLADNITTWKMYTVASTKNGKLGVAEKEIIAFQPFFADLDPPKFLTNGDEISLPVQVRNYTEKKQNVNITMAKADWFSFLGAENQQIDVASGASRNAVFGFKATDTVKDGKQRVTAIAQDDSDAIEKPVTVRPDGEEIVKTETSVFKASTAFDINFPANALPKTPRGELKIYPNLFSHVAESVEGLLQRPYGCGEQTISSTYPNLMILKFTKEDSKLRRKAREYLQKGYEKLIGYQVADGSFTYWGGKDTGDVALTAYALRFLHDAGEFVEVDKNVQEKAHDWLIKQQKPDGSWSQKYYYETAEDPGRTKLLTSYVVRTLALRKDYYKASLQKPMAYLKARNAEIDEPYALALYGLALLDSGNAEEASEIVKRLEKMAIGEANAVYWKLETNTPFYGWGTAGRLETTALVIQLLIREAGELKHENSARNALISRGTLFLLKNKDRYGVWYSTQTTINVLDAFLAALDTANAGTGAAENIQVSINGGDVQNFAVSADRIGPLTVDLTGQLGPLANRVEIKSSGGSTLMAQTVTGHYIEWKDSESSGRTVNQSRALKLDYKCDRMNAAIMQDITCSVATERAGFTGYGMLLAEIGTPPGANVSRESLQEAMDADWSISNYDILPDRIVIYMWSKAGGTKFNFKFKPRYGINAQTPASCVYDYYNPEAKAVGAPLRFAVK
jgi:hypothetical protein